MSAEGSITRWLQLVKQGDGQAAQALWQRYYRRLVGLARKKLRSAPRRVADEEDVVVCAFEKFFRAAEAGKFPNLADRNDLWQVLVLITAQQAVNQVKRQTRQKRGKGRVRGDSVFVKVNDAQVDADIDQVVGREPTPEFAATVAEQCERLLAALESDSLAAIAVWKMEGRTNKEIAHELSCTVRSVERKLRLIREIWSQLASPDAS